MTESKYIWIDGEYVNWQDAKVHVLSHTLHYANGAIEGTKAYKTADGRCAIFKLNEHTKRLINSSRLVTHRNGLLLLVGLLLHGCSSQADDAVYGLQSTVSIVRESKPEFPEKMIAMYRELQLQCIEGRTEVAQAQGWAYDPKADAMTDAAILALDTKKTEEYFDGQKYAVIVTGTRHDNTSLGVTAELSCKLTSTPFKSVDIRDGDCDRISVEYDLPERTGRRIEFKGICDKPTVANIDQSGQTIAVAGNQQCKWNKQEDNPLHIATCSLLPNPIHEGTGLELIAIRKSPDNLRNADQTLPGTEALTIQSLVTIEEATAIDVGGSIQAEKFEAPADSANFPLTQIN